MDQNICLFQIYNIFRAKTKTKFPPSIFSLIYFYHEQLQWGYLEPTTREIKIQDKSLWGNGIYLTVSVLKDDILLMGFSNGTISLLDLNTQKEYLTVRNLFSEAISYVNICENNIISQSGDIIKLLDIQSGECKNTIYFDSMSNEFFTQGNYLVFYDYETYSIVIWNVRTLKECISLKHLRNNGDSTIFLVIEYFINGDILAVVINDYWTLWDLTTGNVVKS